MTPRRTQAFLMFLLMIVAAIAIGGADMARALFGAAIVLGGILLAYFVVLGVRG
jgi:hypothetical protein